MRYALHFALLFVLSVMCAVGCDEYAPIHCEGSIHDNDCPDDGKECTTAPLCFPLGLNEGGSCSYPDAPPGSVCTRGSEASGVCVADVCQEDTWCGGVCDDGIDCTHDKCLLESGVCESTNTCEDFNDCTENICNPGNGLCDFPPVEEGTRCLVNAGDSAGVCEADVCTGPCDPEAAEPSSCPVPDPPEWVCCPGSEYCWRGTVNCPS